MPLVYGIKFYRDIMRLVEEEQNLFIVIKEKRAESKYSDRGSILCSPSRKEYSQVLEGLRDHPR